VRSLLTIAIGIAMTVQQAVPCCRVFAAAAPVSAPHCTSDFNCSCSERPSEPLKPTQCPCGFCLSVTRWFASIDSTIVVIRADAVLCLTSPISSPDVLSNGERVVVPSDVMWPACLAPRLTQRE
jgi:hypothetical protein